MGKALDARERRFVDEYLVDLDPKRAALAAGYSATMASSKAYQWVSKSKIKPHVYAAIQEAQATRARRVQVSQDDVLRELMRIGFSDAWNYAQDEDGRLSLTETAPDDATRAVASIKRKRREIPRKNDDPIVEHTVEFRLWDKNTALANLGRHLGLFKDRVQIDGPLFKAYIGFDPSQDL